MLQPIESEPLPLHAWSRRTFLSSLFLGASTYILGSGKGILCVQASEQGGVFLPPGRGSEGIISYIVRRAGRWDETLYRQILGAANEPKEGDEAQGIAARDETSRRQARALLENTRVGDLVAHPIYEDAVAAFIRTSLDEEITKTIADRTMIELKKYLLSQPEPAIKATMPGLPSDIIACVVKLMSNDELVAVASKLFNPLPGSNIGARGYMGARLQPNSPTDNLDDIKWQVFDGWAYAVGDVLLGTNPVSSDLDSVAAIEETLAEIIATFGLEDVLPHCVLSHIDIQATIERSRRGSTALWFQSLGGVEDANVTFNISVEKMKRHARGREGKYGLYFETGQGADATNGHGKGFDMVIHESRKYGFARALVREVTRAQASAGQPVAPWVHVNDVAGFIGPEVFRTREQLVRCCLEDTVMGKLHGLPIGLDICSTLHMEVNLDDLDWCIDQVMPANPAYLMGLPTKNDPMLSYLTTGFQDHLRVREKFGYKVNDAMWRFFQKIGVVDGQGRPTEHFGQPTWVYLKYRRQKGDKRSDQEILADGRRTLAEVRARGVFIAEGHGQNIWDLAPELDERIRYLYRDSKKSLWAELPAHFSSVLPDALAVRTRSKDRTDYVLHPPTGEKLDVRSENKVKALALSQAGAYDVQFVISDGLNVFALTDDGHLTPYLETARSELEAAGYRVAPEHILVTSGRVRAGYRIGEMLFGEIPEPDSRRAILHVIGERPGSGHHALSVYISAPSVAVWARQGATDHNITRVVSGIADTALTPGKAATETVNILKEILTT